MISVACTVLLIHGGSFVGGYETLQSHKALTDAHVVRVTYPLRNVPAAYRAVEKEASRYRRVVAVGESVGGSIAIWLAARRKVRAAVSIGGPTDFPRWFGHYKHISSAVRGGTWQWSPRRVYRGQRPVWQIHYLGDVLVPYGDATLPGAARTLVDEEGHNVAPPKLLRQRVQSACGGKPLPPVVMRLIPALA